MKLWHFTYYVDKNNPNSEIKSDKITAETGKEATEEFNEICELMGYDPFITVFRCEGEVSED